MKSINVLKRSMVVAALVLSGMAVSQMQANQVIFTFDSPSGNVGPTEPYTVGGLTITAAGYVCYHATGGLCANNPNTNYYTHTTDLYGNADGLGIANQLSGTEHEIPNNEFVQIDFSSIRTHNTITSIEFDVTDIHSSWSLYDSLTAGVLEGAQGNRLVNNALPTTTSYTTPNNPTFNLFSILAGTNCDVVLNQIIVHYTPNTPTPEPATLLMTGLTLVGLAGIIKKTRKRS